MKMNIKNLVLVVSLVLAGSAAASAQAVEKITVLDNSAVVTSATEKKVKTVTAKIKVNKTKNGRTFQLSTKDGTYSGVVDASLPDHDEIEAVLNSRNGKKLIVSGILDSDTKVFTIIRIGGMGSSSDK